MNAGLFFICGPHTCGKTSILKALEADGDIVFRGSEIGKDLYYERRFHTEGAGDAFEFEVAERELKRDHAIIHCLGAAGVETWHPGNMAYAAVRNPETVPLLREKAMMSPFINSARGVWIQISEDEMRKRTKTFHHEKDWAWDFYNRINNQLDYCFKLINLRDRITVIDGNRPLDAVIADVKAVL